MITKFARAALSSTIYWLPYIVGAILGAASVLAFWPDYPFLLLALITLLLLCIIGHWSWAHYIGEQPWAQKDKA